MLSPARPTALYVPHSWGRIGKGETVGGLGRGGEGGREEEGGRENERERKRQREGGKERER